MTSPLHHPGYERSLLGLAMLLLGNALLGPAGLGLLDYPLPTTLLNQLRGLELVTVALVVPTLVGAAVLARRGNRAAPLVAFGPCGYAAYMFVQYVVGPDRVTYSPVLLVHLVVFATAAALTAWSWSLASRTTWPPPAPRRRRGWAVLLLVLAAFVVLRYLPLIIGSVTNEMIPDEFAEAPAFFWSIVLLDLGVVVPATVAAAVAALRGAPLALPATYAVVGWFALVPPSVAAMAAVMVARDDPYASVPTLVLLAATSVVTTVAAVRMFRRLLLDLGLRESVPAAAVAPVSRPRS